MRRAPRLTVITALAGSAIVFLLGGCGGYHQQYRPDKPQPTAVGPEMHFVEADDEGWFWAPEQANNALAAAREAGSAGDAVVVVFIHGWHHLSKCCDENLEGFKEVLGKLDGQLRRDMYKEARTIIHGGDPGKPVRVIGVYVGWRGRSLPGFLDYLTFWGRKSAAERVGDTDLQEFLIRLRNLHQSFQARPEELRAADGSPKPAKLFGLVAIGHSFGGQVLLRATNPYLEHKLISLNDQPGYLRDKPAPPPSQPLTLPVEGFGDLVVLINPAVEAAAYQRLHALSRLNFAPSQWPLMLTISAENDTARKKLFRAGRIAGEIFTGKPGKEEREDTLERTALGYATEQVTHVLKPVNEHEKLVKQQLPQRPDTVCPECAGKTFDWYDWVGAAPPATPRAVSPRLVPDSLSADIPKEFTGGQRQVALQKLAHQILCHDFSKSTTFFDVVLEPAPGQTPPRHEAFIVAEAKKNVIDNHSGMFSRPLMDFLTTYIGFAEAKRLFTMLPRPADAPPELQDCP